MTSVFGKLQALLVSTVGSPTQPSPTSPQKQELLPGSPSATFLPHTVNGRFLGGLEAASASSSPGLSDDTLQPRKHGRPRRQTDATVSTISTATSIDVSGSLVRQQDVEKILPHRMSDLERISRLHPVSKVLQQDSWDCGLACVCMILRAFGQATCSISQLARQANTDSVWTIDLAVLIHRNVHADFTFYTQCVGINPEYSSNDFYQGAIDDDEVRVQKLFSRVLADQSVRIMEIVIPLIDLERFLVHRQYVAILLVDKAVLKCVSCEMTQSNMAAAAAAAAKRKAAHGRSKSVNVFRSATATTSSAVDKASQQSSYAAKHPNSSPSKSKAGGGVLSWFSRRRQMKDGYLGHYILLIAYIPSLDMFLYRDPGIPEEFCMASAAAINTARTRPGTDADCIIIKLP
ncbi:hypothetical protein LPJ73_000365 [Coemansia sp. RSA 2703]|nr:hypothetical protein LPJ73_000365 [Coemansia sp. RSA 2703]KAJ2379092.1 hypothetical protein IW150_000391 [Coemansia sp. RSA 2607]KAJ2397879.1 hypothetical protein GGI05_000408 [Coemansia sp. RSA 2603]